MAVFQQKNGKNSRPGNVTQDNCAFSSMERSKFLRGETIKITSGVKAISKPVFNDTDKDKFRSENSENLNLPKTPLRALLV